MVLVHTISARIGRQAGRSHEFKPGLQSEFQDIKGNILKKNPVLKKKINKKLLSQKTSTYKK